MKRPLHDDAAPVGRSRAATWAVRAVVGLVTLVSITLVLAVVGFFVMLNSWPDAFNVSPDERRAQATASAAVSVAPKTDGLDGSNEAYRERRGSPEGDAQAALSIPAVEAALSPLATGEPLRRDAVVAALSAAGFDSFDVTPETTTWGDPATTFGVGVSVPGGCVVGGVAPDGVRLGAGGPIADGGCLEMPTH